MTAPTASDFASRKAGSPSSCSARAARRPTTIRMGLARFRRPIRDYFAICDSYFRAVRNDGAKGIEAIDMARRGLHNEAAELLQECLAGKVEMDFDTARRLFTLICVLHIKQSTTAVDSSRPAPASRAG